MEAGIGSPAVEDTESVLLLLADWELSLVLKKLAQNQPSHSPLPGFLLQMRRPAVMVPSDKWANSSSYLRISELLINKPFSLLDSRNSPLSVLWNGSVINKGALVINEQLGWFQYMPLQNESGVVPFCQVKKKQTNLFLPIQVALLDFLRKLFRDAEIDPGLT